MNPYRFLRHYLILVVMSLSSFGIIYAQTETDPAAQIDALVNQLVNKKQFNGSLLIAKGNTIVLNKGYGMADIEKSIPNTPDTKFRIGVLTEQFTSMAILMLQEQNKLSIEDSLCKYVDDCPANWKSIHLVNLLNHTSGLPDRSDFDDADTWSKQPTTPLKIVERVKSKPTGTVGSGSYSSFNYSMLGYVIQKASGQTYSEYLRDHIFTPLGMKNTGVNDQLADVSPMAQGYNDTLQPADAIDLSTSFAQSDIYSTVGDLLLWNQALYSGKVVSQTTLNDFVFKNIQPEDLGKNGYGLMIYSLPPNHMMYFYTGYVTGFSSWLIYVPDFQLTIAALGNYEEKYTYAFTETTTTMLIMLMGLMPSS